MKIKYTSYLRHAAEPYTSEAGRKILGSGVSTSSNKGGIGNPNHDPKTGQFTFSPSTAGKAFNTASTGIGKAAQNMSRIKTSKDNPRLDLSNLSDQELNKILNRERMEMEYNRYFNSPQESKGKVFIDTILPAAATVAGIVGTGFTIYGIMKNK